MALTDPRADVVVVARLTRLDALATVRGRLEALAGRYQPRRPVAFRLRWSPAASVLVATLRLDGSTPAPSPAPISWGRGSSFATVRRLLEAGDGELARLPTPNCTVGVADDRVRIATSGGMAQVLYEADGADARVWSTHALAAGHVAHGRLAIDHTSVAELMGCNFVGGEATLLVGVRALDPGSCVEISSRGIRLWSCTPPSERWQPTEPAESAALAEAALFETLAEGLRGARRPVAGLTAGLDSLTIALALRELGQAFTTFTFDTGQSTADISGAMTVARSLGLAHDVGGIHWYSEPGGMEATLARAALADGEAEVGYGIVAWPDRMDRWITGLGAETGRAFYWRAYGPRRPGDLPRRALTHVLRMRFEPRLVGAAPARLAELRTRWDSWIDQATKESGHRGSAALDVVYAQQRVRRWGRSQMQPGGAPLVPAFASAPMTRALCALPAEDRRVSGWQRRFVASRAPDLAPAIDAIAQRSLVRDRATLVARQARRAAGSRRRPTPPELVWHRVGEWAERATYIGWLRDEVLTSELLQRALGGSWLAEQRERFLAGDPFAAQVAVLAAGPVALSLAIDDLVSAPSPSPTSNQPPSAGSPST